MNNDTLLQFPGSRLVRVSRLFITRCAGAAACALLAAGVLAPAQAVAQTRILPLPASQASTVPSNGDVNPYGVAFVPNTAATDGTLQHGNILVSNFNNSNNLQGTGTTIVQITPRGQTSLFYTSQGGMTGLTAALGILGNGIVIAGYLPSSDGTFQTAGPGGLIFLDRRGAVIATIADPTFINGPWGMAVYDHGNGLAQLFISNVEAGTVTRINLTYDPSGESVKMAVGTIIGSGFAHAGDPAAFEVGPSGLAYDPSADVLFVASEEDSSVYAISGAGAITTTAGLGTLVYQDAKHLHGPLDLALAPNGHLLVANSDGQNADPNQPSELVEFTPAGEFLSEYSLDPNNGGAFGVAIHSFGFGAIRVAAVDDNQNVLNMWTTVLQ